MSDGPIVGRRRDARGGEPTLIVCDRSEIARIGIAASLRRYGINAVGAVSSADSALRAVRSTPPDVLLIDLSMPDAETAIRGATELGVTVIAIGVEADQRRPFSALVAGAVGYLTKDLPAKAWAESIRAALIGEAPMSSELTARLIEAYREMLSSRELVGLRPSDARLTSREWDVLTRVAEGKTNRAVAAELFISVETVRTHVSNILTKLQAPNRSAAAAKYHQLVRAV
jgi:NarL family two-component system response regulator LiaR